MPELRVLPYGDQGILVQCADLKTAMALREWLQTHPVDGQAELIPAARTVLIRLDPEVEQGAVSAQLPSLGDLNSPITSRDPSAPVQIEVVYDGPDLGAVAELTGLSVPQVIRAHTQTLWVVAFSGFAPGFGYLAGGDSALVVPRRQDPRTKVPAGSVGLAGEFSGVYPQASPGGWQLIGRTQAVLWDDKRNPPALFVPGILVEFVRVSR